MKEKCMRDRMNPPDEALLRPPNAPDPGISRMLKEAGECRYVAEQIGVLTGGYS